jgi:stalled ribosome rescue protein Dom34
MPHFHAVACIDHAKARVFLFNEETAETRTVLPADEHPHLHHKHGSRSGKRSAADQAYLHAIVEAMKEAQEWLIIGPGDAKGEFVAHVEDHDHTLRARIAGVETVDHPTDGQILALARQRFKALDRMKPQR